MHFTQASNFGFELFFFRFQLGIFLCAINQRQGCLLVTDGVKQVAQAFDFVLTISFMSLIF